MNIKTNPLRCFIYPHVNCFKVYQILSDYQHVSLTMLRLTLRLAVILFTCYAVTHSVTQDVNQEEVDVDDVDTDTDDDVIDGNDSDIEIDTAVTSRATVIFLRDFVGSLSSARTKVKT